MLTICLSIEALLGDNSITDSAPPACLYVIDAASAAAAWEVCSAGSLHTWLGLPNRLTAPLCNLTAAQTT